MKKSCIVLLAFMLCFVAKSKADEGMWLPILLKKYNIEDMRKAGFKLTAEDIYSVNKASLKDAVVGLGRAGSPFHHFCTGELISNKGLMVTNHHCGYGAIQAHSSLEHNYLKDGFWAMNKSEELVNEGITASFFIKMEDVSSEVLSSVKDDMTEKQRFETISANIKNLVAKAEKGTGYRANIKAFFGGNQYFLSMYEIYQDVRLVGAPPSAIGKFGGDTDNWMWPRHTGDFSMFRIYANKDNRPASYSEDNIPLIPKKSFKISMKGVKEGDFTMVFGYPGTTTEYLTSDALNLMTKVDNPHKIKIRTKKLDLMRADMDSSPKVRIQYSAKYAGVANSWKRWQGEIKGLKRINAIEKKTILETKFIAWLSKDTALKAKYGKVIPELKNLYSEMQAYSLAYAYAVEAGIRGAESVSLALKYAKLEKLLSEKNSKEEIAVEIKKLEKSSLAFFKNYNKSTDQKMFAELLNMYSENMEARFSPSEFAVVKKKYKSNFKIYASKVYSKSIFVDQNKLNSFLKKPSAKKLAKDPVYKMASSIMKSFRNSVYPKYYELKKATNKLQRLYIAGLMEMQKDKTFYPDANSTFRVHYGKIAGFKPKDVVTYSHQSTIEGIMEKDNPEIFDYDVPAKLKELYRTKDYGQYANVNNTIPVCFVATNHTTGGNSGSPVLNANGELIGLNFDRAWEGVMSDLMYDASICRNVSLDIRFVLFIVDKFAGAGYLIDEMELVK